MSSAIQALVSRITSGLVRWVAIPDRRRPFETALRESRSFLVVVVAQVIASAIICAAANRPILAGPPHAYATFLWAGVVFGDMAVAGTMFHRRLLQPDSLPAADAYRRAWGELQAALICRESVALVSIAFPAAPHALSAFSPADQAIRRASVHLRRESDRRLNSTERVFALVGIQSTFRDRAITTSLDWLCYGPLTTLAAATFIWTARPHWL